MIEANCVPWIRLLIFLFQYRQLLEDRLCLRSRQHRLLPLDDGHVMASQQRHLRLISEDVAKHLLILVDIHKELFIMMGIYELGELYV